MTTRSRGTGAQALDLCPGATAGLTQQPAVPSAEPGRGVFILGMHRSGTSATARALNLLGLPLCRPADLIATRNGNVRGYWESLSLLRYNDNLLNTLQAAWWCPPARQEVRQRLHAMPAERLMAARRAFESVHLSSEWAWKDPRLCLLLPFWKAALGASYVAFLVIRDPAEIADSLYARNKMNRAWGLALWESYTRQALQNLKGMPVFVQRYRDLLEDPASWCANARGFLQAHGFTGVPGGEEEVASFIDSGLRHHDRERSPAGLVTAEQRALYESCEQLAGAHDSFIPENCDTISPAAEDELAAQRQRWHRINKKQPQGKREGASMSDTLPPGWQKWLARNAMLRLGDEEMVRITLGHGFSEDAVRHELARLRSDPCYQAGAEAAQSLQKIESVLEIKRQLLAQLPSTRQVERRRGVRRGDFLARYYAQNSPVILLDVADTWPARTRWTLDYLDEQLGDEVVEIMANRDSNHDYERRGDVHRTQLRFTDFISYLRQNPRGNDQYLVANNGLLDLPAAKRLREDFEGPAEYLDEETSPGRVFLWLGPGGTVTPLHHDVMNILIVQVFGRKRFMLIDPLRAQYVYNDDGVFSAVDAADPDYARFPLFQFADPVTVELEPGEALFIPVGWWHYVESLDLSASLSFTNFVFPNEYHWRHPDPSRP